MVDVYRIDDEGYCYYCDNRTNLLADASHPPCDGNANYICKDHLSPDAVIHTVELNTLQVTGEEDGK